MDIDVERQHAARVALIDPLLPADPPLSGDVIATVGALGAPTFREFAPDSLDATWGPLRRHILTVRLAGADLGPLLARWEDHLAGVAAPGDDDCVAQITWPSRDTAAVPDLIRHGFAPLAVTAIRRAGAYGPAPSATRHAEDFGPAGGPAPLTANRHMADVSGLAPQAAARHAAPASPADSPVPLTDDRPAGFPGPAPLNTATRHAAPASPADRPAPPTDGRRPASLPGPAPLNTATRHAAPSSPADRPAPLTDGLRRASFPDTAPPTAGSIRPADTSDPAPLAASSADTPDSAPLAASPAQSAETPGSASLRTPAIDPAVAIRHATKADLVACVALGLEVIRYDAQFGLLTERPSTEAGLRQNMAEMLDRDRPCIWLAEVAGRPVGIVTVDLPPHSDWIAGRTSASPAAYLGLGGVRADLRGTGIGSALVTQVHRELDEAGVAVTLLHYAMPNPRSVPFWSVHGYRPLWTSWNRRPAIRL